MRRLLLIAGMMVALGLGSVQPAFIPASEIEHSVLVSEKAPGQFECYYTGKSSTPPWLNGRDAPWTVDVRIDDVYDDDDVLTSMAEDANGRIYVCYETMNSSGNYAWGLATSADNGSTWDNRAFFATGLDVRYPEIAISTDGKVWIWGSLGGGSYSDEVIWMKSIDGWFNNPDSLEGFFWFGAGNVNNRIYPEVVTWGDNTQLVLSTWTFDNGTETVMSYIYATDGGAGGSWNISNLSADSEPDGMTTIGANYDGANYIAIHGWEENTGDWDVNCMFDTLGGSGGLSGWVTTNTADDRYPSVFCSNGNAYCAYQAGVGVGNNDIMYSYSTDYGLNWSSIANITNDAQNEQYPRLYGDDATIGVDYVYNNRIRFNYSLDNGINWLTTPETVDENSTVRASYHSVSLLYTPAYWYAAWEDNRVSGSDGVEIYTSRRIFGQGDITHRPALITINYNFSFFKNYSNDKYLIHHAEQPIDRRLGQIIAGTSSNELIPVFVMLAKQMNPDYFFPRVERMAKEQRRLFVIKECQVLARDDQKELLAYLKQAEKMGQVADINAQWTSNTICLKANRHIIEEIAKRNDVWEIGFDEPTQLIGAVDIEEPAYESIDFIAEDGREICWGVDRINANDVWPDYTGAGVVVGHMDTGVNYNHNDLNDHMWDGSPTYPNHGYDFVDNDDNPIDPNGHGTQTAGIVAGDGTSGSNTGVAPDAQIMALRINPGGASEMGDAIQFALNNGADLLSCSVGWEDPSSSIKNWCRSQSNTVYAAGIIWSNAAGNGDGAGGHYSVPQDINSPADCPAPWYAPNGGNSASVAVGASDISDNIASYSSYGPTEWNTGTYNDYPYPPGLMKPDVSAPGHNVKSLDHLNNSGYDDGIDGTSFAQPHLAGTVALMLEKSPSLTPRQIDSIIQNHAVFDIEDPGRDSLAGAGRIDALMAVNAISPGVKSAQLWVINQPTATGILQVTDITQAQNQPWIIAVNPVQFTVPIDDSQEVWVQTDTTGQGLTWGQTYYDTLLVWSNSVIDANPDSVPVVLIMATVGAEERLDPSPAPVCLLSVTPNPFHDLVEFNYRLTHAQNIKLAIYDVSGRIVKSLVNSRQSAGNVSVTWDGTDETGMKVATGIYFCRIDAEGESRTGKLILIK